MNTVVVIGLDSATWSLLMPWITEGKLKTLKKLVENGTYGYLKSCDPPVTFPAWKCYSTGKNPGKLGVYSFVGLDKEKKDLIFHTGGDFKEKELWDFLGEYGISSCVINMPGTCPPSKTAIMVSGPPIIGSDYYHPKEIAKYLDEIGYEVDPEIWPGSQRNKQEHEHLKELIHSRFKLADKLRKEYNVNFWHVTVFYIDKIQHSYFNDKHILEDYWKFIDKTMGKFLEKFGDSTIIFLISDHGATELKNTFYINEYLLKQGYLKLKQKQENNPSKSGFITASLNVLRRNPVLFTTLKRLFKNLSPEFLRNKIKSKYFKSAQKNEVRKSKFLYKIDWENSTLLDIGMGFGLIYSLSDDVDIKKLKEELENLEDPVTGEKFLKALLKDETYTGHMENAPDLVIVPTSNTMITEVIRDNPKIWGNAPNDWECLHEREGIFLAYGPSIKKGERIEGVKIYDIVPTVLHIFNIPIPPDIDGRVLKEIFEENSDFALREVKYQEYNEEKEKLKKIIRRLRF